ncbi:MAG: hypothetical protein Q9218_007367 [Villophora microphyllina]
MASNHSDTQGDSPEARLQPVLEAIYELLGENGLSDQVILGRAEHIIIFTQQIINNVKKANAEAQANAKAQADAEAQANAEVEKAIEEAKQALEEGTNKLSIAQDFESGSEESALSPAPQGGAPIEEPQDDDAEKEEESVDDDSDSDYVPPTITPSKGTGSQVAPSDTGRDPEPEKLGSESNAIASDASGHASEEREPEKRGGINDPITPRKRKTTNMLIPMTPSKRRNIKSRYFDILNLYHKRQDSLPRLQNDIVMFFASILSIPNIVRLQSAVASMQSSPSHYVAYSAQQTDQLEQVVTQYRTVFSEPAKTACTEYQRLFDLARLASVMDNLRVALDNEENTETVRLVKDVCLKNRLGTKTKGLDLATQYVTFQLFGKTPRDPQWKDLRKKVMEKKHTGDVLHEISEAFGSQIFFILPSNTPTFCLKAHSQTEFVGEVARKLAAAEDVRFALEAVASNVMGPLERGTAPQIALLEAATSTLQETAVDTLFTPSKPLASTELALRPLNQSFLEGIDADGSEKADGSDGSDEEGSEEQD